MATAFALITSDPNLLECELRRLSGLVTLSEGDRENVAGLGSYAQDEVLLQRFSAGTLPPSVTALLPAHRSEALVYHARQVPVSQAVEENVQPFRFRRWFFCQTGGIPDFAPVRPRVLALLPDHLRRIILGSSDAEVAFALFLRNVRQLGRADEQTLAASEVARVLGETGRQLQELASAEGAARVPSIQFIATTPQLLVAASVGDEPLFYRLLEGSERCDVCGLPKAGLEAQSRMRSHARRRTVAVASRLPPRSTGWLELAGGNVLAVDSSLRISTAPTRA